MDNGEFILVVALAYVVAVQQLVTAYSILFDDVPTAREKVT
jgi:hypothetical protein